MWAGTPCAQQGAHRVGSQWPPWIEARVAEPESACCSRGDCRQCNHARSATKLLTVCTATCTWMHGHWPPHASNGCLDTPARLDDVGGPRGSPPAPLPFVTRLGCALAPGMMGFGPCRSEQSATSPVMTDGTDSHRGGHRHCTWFMPQWGRGTLWCLALHFSAWHCACHAWRDVHGTMHLSAQCHRVLFTTPSAHILSTVSRVLCIN